MPKYYNPSLYEEPNDQPARSVTLVPRESLLHWLENTGRFKSFETDEVRPQEQTEDIDDILESDLYVMDDDDQQGSDE